MPKAVQIKKWDRYWRLMLTWFDKYIRSWKRNDTVRYVECICDCWTKKRIKLASIRSWAIQSCWCQKIESSLKKSNKHKTHWMSWTRFYLIYKLIKRRCNCKNNKSYKNYWWKWITYEWKTFEDFKKDMYESYIKHIKLYWEKNTTIDRIDNNWNYCKNNCKRSTIEEQANNKTTNHIVMYEWKPYTISNLCRHLNIPYKTTSSRIRSWWNINDAIKY